MAETGGIDLGWLPAWAQTAAAIGMTAAAFVWAMRGKWDSAKLAEPERTHADEVVERQATEQTEILKTIRDAMFASRDAAVATRDAVLTMSAGMVASRANQERLITAQEKIVEIMKAQDDQAIYDLKMENQAYRFLEKARDREERDERDRAPEHRRPPRRE